MAGAAARCNFPCGGRGSPSARDTVAGSEGAALAPGAAGALAARPPTPLPLPSAFSHLSSTSSVCDAALTVTRGDAPPLRLAVSTPIFASPSVFASPSSFADKARGTRTAEDADDGGPSHSDGAGATAAAGGLSFAAAPALAANSWGLGSLERSSFLRASPSLGEPSGVGFDSVFAEPRHPQSPL